MKDPKKQERRGYVSAGDKAATEIMERRSAPRQHFVADVQIIEVASGLRLSARVCDLVTQGCYVDTLRPFPVGTLVRIRLKKGDTTIEPSGKVVYQSPGLGMGIAFQDLTPENQAALEKWVSGVPGQQGIIEAFMSSIERDLRPTLLRQPSNEYVELIQLLVKKGVLTKAEALGLLKLPLDD